MKSKVSNKAFTLLELLVVIAIIGILSSVVLASLNSARESGRDSKRVTEIKQIQTALELYYFKNGSYPQVNANGFFWVRSSCATQGGTDDEYYDAMQLLVDDGLLPNIPLDPINEVSDKHYCYRYFSHNHDANNCNTTASDVADDYEYVLFFATENTEYNYPLGRPGSPSSGYCVFGPKRG